jgi:hypothetical protein
VVLLSHGETVYPRENQGWHHSGNNQLIAAQSTTHYGWRNQALVS